MAAKNETIEKPSVTGEPENRAPVMRPGYPPIAREAGTFHPLALQKLLDGSHSDIRNLIKQVIGRPEFRYYEGTDVSEYRELVLRWTRQIADTGM